ncbi:MAG: hypothetical protein OEV24_02055 [Cyclobacteriaceae bacterium]|nr:hypothetical protein [Cyclobacteriaceae bacterium]MDH5250628.1 hypothetical protein [Cyclobacteriaceae bacterium]
MNYILKLICMGTVILIVMARCTKNPKVIDASSNNIGTAEGSGIFSEDQRPAIPDLSKQSLGSDLHTVTVEEVLPTSRYVYLRVKEGKEAFWIATNKQEVSVGEIYFYRGGLMKTNFESKEHKRVFDRLYLVSAIVKADHGNQSTPIESKSSGTRPAKEVDVKGSVKIADLVANPAKYAGKTIQISGQCVKINPNIMGRNWVHLQDGSKDDYDLVITCAVQIPVGHTVTLTGKVVLNKDFGAGYQYDILLEEGAIVE